MSKIIISGVALLLVWVSTGHAEPPKKLPIADAETVLEYVNTEAFDNALEVALINREGVIVIQTENQRPDWEGRLVEWCAAWKEAHKNDRPPSSSQPKKNNNIFLKVIYLFGGGGGEKASPISARVTGMSGAVMPAGASGISVEIPPDTPKEMRLLIENCLDRSEKMVREGVNDVNQWWKDKKKREKRVALMKPYGMRINKKDGAYRVELSYAGSKK